MATRRRRLSKAEQWEYLQEAVTNVINSNVGLFKKDKASAFNEHILNELAKMFEPKSGGPSIKVNSQGEVFCNYFEEYYPAEDFNTKLSKPNRQTGERKEVYKSNCKKAEVILRKLKTLKMKVTKQVTEAFRSKKIDEDKFTEILNKLDEALDTKYYDVDEVPTIWDIIG